MFKKVIRYWLPPVLWMILIFWASSFHTLRASPVNWQDFVIRKIAHFLEYLILFVLFFRAFKGTTKLYSSIIYYLSFIISFLYAASDEFHQTLVAGRSGMIRDILIDTIGILFGSLFVLKTHKIRYKLPS